MHLQAPVSLKYAERWFFHNEWTKPIPSRLSPGKAKRLRECGTYWCPRQESNLSDYVARLMSFPRAAPALLREAVQPLWATDSTGRRNTIITAEAEGVLQLKYRTRTRYTDAQKALMWERPKEGWTLHQIGHLFDRPHTSIYTILSRTCGIRPPDRRRNPDALPSLTGSLRRARCVSAFMLRGRVTPCGQRGEPGRF